MPTGRRRLASSLRAAEPSSPNEAKALSNNPADNTRIFSSRVGGKRLRRAPIYLGLRESRAKLRWEALSVDVRSADKRAIA